MGRRSRVRVLVSDRWSSRTDLKTEGPRTPFLFSSRPWRNTSSTPDVTWVGPSSMTPTQPAVRRLVGQEQFSTDTKKKDEEPGVWSSPESQRLSEVKGKSLKI